MRSLDVSLLRVQREARRLEDPEDEHPDRRRDEERPSPDLVAQQPCDDRDDEVVDVEDSVLSGRRDGSRRVCGGRPMCTHDEELRRRVGDYGAIRMIDSGERTVRVCHLLPMESKILFMSARREHVVRRLWSALPTIPSLTVRTTVPR